MTNNEISLPSQAKIARQSKEYKKVNRYTRAPRDGILIRCPQCNQDRRVYHFRWLHGKCIGCKQDIAKNDYLILPDEEQLHWITIYYGKSKK